jgi:phosphopentomutase
LPDAAEYGDAGANTLGNIAAARGGLQLPALERLGLGCIAPIAGLSCPERPLACYGKMAEASKGKDTTTGHWELAGAPVSRPFPYYPNGFPADIMDRFAVLTGRKALGNKAASELRSLPNWEKNTWKPAGRLFILPPTAFCRLQPMKI